MESAGSLAPEHAQLMAQRKDLKPQVRRGTKDGNEQTEESKSDCKHIGDDRAAHPTALCFLRRVEFTTGTGRSRCQTRLTARANSSSSSLGSPAAARTKSSPGSRWRRSSARTP